jgi:hypothetical protein
VPSIVRSSDPLSSPLMITLFPMFTMSLSIVGRLVVVGSGALGGGAPGAVAEGGRTASSRFHMY